MAAAYLDVVASLVIAGSAAVLHDAVAAVEVDDTVAAVAADDAVADAQIDDAVAAYHNGDDVADDLEIADECDHSHYRHKNSNLRVKVIHHPWQREVSSYLRKTVHWKVICLQN